MVYVLFQDVIRVLVVDGRSFRALNKKNVLRCILD